MQVPPLCPAALHIPALLQLHKVCTKAFLHCAGASCTPCPGLHPTPRAAPSLHDAPTSAPPPSSTPSAQPLWPEGFESQQMTLQKLSPFSDAVPCSLARLSKSIQRRLKPSCFVGDTLLHRETASRSLQSVTSEHFLQRHFNCPLQAHRTLCC